MSQSGRIVLLLTSPRVAVGLLSADAWAALRSGPVYVDDPASPLGSVLSAAGFEVRALPADPASLVSLAVDQTVTWCAGETTDDAVSQALMTAVAAAPEVTLEVVRGSWDLPGARLLDVVTTMDRLRSAGGCPWDAKQDHASLAPYLLEEAYETFQTIEDGDLAALREEIGDVLLQVAFHARIAEELPVEQRWTIDDVATGLVDKLVRRHPHVFGDADVADADEVNTNWEAIKATERGDKSVLANVPLAAAALTLAATMQRKASRAGMNLGVEPLGDAVAAFEAAPGAELAGALLWSAVAAMRAADLDAEATLRARSREFRDSATGS